MPHAQLSTLIRPRRHMVLHGCHPKAPQTLFTTPDAVALLRQAVRDVKRQYRFKIDAWVLLPDQMHCVWSLPPGDSGNSRRWGLIKATFTKTAKHRFHNERWLSNSRTKHRESTLWQRRFWEHQIRDDRDFRRHLDYVHYNPVKHGLVNCVKDWPNSSFHKYVEKGVYPEDWGIGFTAETGKYGE